MTALSLTPGRRRLNKCRNQERRNATAKRIQAARAKLSDSQQITVLDFRLGVGRGAERERLRLHERINAARKKAS